MINLSFSIFIINMEGGHERRRYMEAQLDRLCASHSFFKGIDGRSAPTRLSQQWIDDEGSITTYGKPLTPGEKGCALSHILLWEEIARSGKPALVLEDDVILPDDLLHTIIPALLPELRGNRVILLRHLANSFWWRSAIHLDGVNFELRKPNHRTLMAAAYLLTPTSAGNLLGHLRANKLTHPLDWWYRPDGLGFTRVVDTWATSEDLITSNYGFESLIDATEGDRDHLKNLSATGRMKRSAFLFARRLVTPPLRIFRSVAFKPIWPQDAPPA